MKLFATIFTFSLALSAMAQTGAPVETTISPADQSALDAARRLTKIEALWTKPLAWKENGASTLQIAEDVRAQLGPDAPPIEVRGPEVNRSTFALEEAPLGVTLCAIAELANCRVWVFSNGIVIAPEIELSDEERSAVKAGRGGVWDESSAVIGSTSSWGGREQINRIVVRVVGAEVQKHPAPPQPAPPAPDPSAPRVMTHSSNDLSAPFEVPFGELSPPSQKLLQELLDAQVKRNNPAAKPPTIAPENVVGFDDNYGNQRRLFVRGTTLQSWQTLWVVPR